MINVVRAVPAVASVQTPTLVNRTDAQLSPICPAIGLSVGNLLAGVLGNFSPALEMGRREASLSDDRRFPDFQAWGECEFHLRFEGRILHYRLSADYADFTDSAEEG